MGWGVCRTPCTPFGGPCLLPPGSSPHFCRGARGCCSPHCLSGYSQGRAQLIEVLSLTVVSAQAHGAETAAYRAVGSFMLQRESDFAMRAKGTLVHRVPEPSHWPWVVLEIS